MASVCKLSCASLNSPNGILKVLHLTFGIASILFISYSYIPYWALNIFYYTNIVVVAISLTNLILNLTINPSILRARICQIFGSIFHIFAGLVLIATSINLVEWSEYDRHCGFQCPTIYYIGVAKILTFMNGTLYAIHGCLEARGEDEEDFLAEESIPFLLPLRPRSPPIIVIDSASSSNDEESSSPVPHFSGNPSAFRKSSGVKASKGKNKNKQVGKFLALPVPCSRKAIIESVTVTSQMTS